MKRLEDCWKMYPDRQVYILPEGKIEAFFDGDVMLDKDDPRIQMDEGKSQVRLSLVPAFGLRALVSVPDDRYCPAKGRLAPPDGCSRRPAMVGDRGPDLVADEALLDGVKTLHAGLVSELRELCEEVRDLRAEASRREL